MGAQEGIDLLLDAVEHVVRVRGRTDIQFCLIGGGLVTPPVSEGALPGVMRAEVIRLTRAEERPIEVAELERSSEVFVSNALGIRPVTKVNGRAVGDGVPGLITQMLAVRL